MKNNIGYTPLHVHSIYSQLDGFSKVEDIVDRCVEIGAKGACITDHAFATSHYALSTLCNKKGIKPIFAVESYYAPKSNVIHEKIENFKDYYHITMIAKTQVGYKNLMKLISNSFLEGKYRKARTDLENLEKYNEGVIVLTACLGGYPSQMLLANRDEEAYDWCRIMKEIYGKDRFFIELTNTNLEMQFEVNRKLVKLAEDLDLSLIITPDSHYSRVDDSEFHRAMVCININRPFVPMGKEKEGEDVDEGSMFYTPGEYFLKAKEDLLPYYLEFPNHDQYFENTNIIADSIEWIHLNKEKKFPCEYEDPNKELMSRIVESFNDKISKGVIDINFKDEYLCRIKEELSVITKMGFSDYFIEIQDIVKWSNSQGITTGPGRGCFHKDTNVLTFDKTVPISKIKPGMRVLSKNLKWNKVISVLSYPINEKLICISYKDSENLFVRIFSTCDHRHLVSLRSDPDTRFYLKAEDVDRSLHFLIGANDKTDYLLYQKISIIDVYHTNQEENIVYDLIVESDPSFLVGGHFVHNSGAGSFINFLLDITRVNPLKYDLLFSRRFCAV